jgi:hypothetical protein
MYWIPSATFTLLQVDFAGPASTGALFGASHSLWQRRVISNPSFKEAIGIRAPITPSYRSDHPALTETTQALVDHFPDLRESKEQATRIEAASRAAVKAVVDEISIREKRLAASSDQLLRK